MTRAKAGARARWTVTRTARWRRALGLALGLALPAACSDQQLIPIHGIGGGPPDGGAPCSAAMIGFATQGGGTTGGEAGSTVTVDTPADLQARAGDDAPLVIRLSGLLTVSEQVRVKSNKTIIGVGDASGLTGSGFTVAGASNVILRNLVIEKAVGQDAVTVDGSHNVWIDHCDLSSDRDHAKDYYDGLVDITHASDFVTVSWTQFRDHYQTSLIGHADDNGAEDTGHLTVTFEHNLFLRTYSHNPSIRFGRLHVLNNYYLDIDGGGIYSRESAEALVEGNYFDNVRVPYTTHFDSPVDGFLSEENNVLVASSGQVISQTASWTPPYDYTAQLASDVPAAVTACAGVGRLAL